MFYTLFEVLSKKKVNFQTKITSEADFKNVWQENVKGNSYFSFGKAKNGKPILANAYYVQPLVELFAKGLHPDPKIRVTTDQSVKQLNDIFKAHAATLIQKTVRGHLSRKKSKLGKE